jgi:hypothetical protein
MSAEKPHWRPWIRYLYKDLLRGGNEPKPDEINHWIGILQSRSNSSGEEVAIRSVAGDIVYSEEHCKIIVKDAYSYYLSRIPKNNEEWGWINALKNKEPVENIIAGICDSIEYKQNNPVPINFIYSLYYKLLKRQLPPRDEEVQGWVNQINSGRAIKSIVKDFLWSKEYCDILLAEYWDKFMRAKNPPIDLGPGIPVILKTTAHKRTHLQILMVEFVKHALYLRVVSALP